MRRRSVASSFVKSASIAPCRAMTTTSNPWYSPAALRRRADSRNRRRVRLRLTAPPKRELTAYPNRQGWSVAALPLARARNASTLPLALTPSRNTASKSALRRNRWSTGMVKHRSTAIWRGSPRTVKQGSERSVGPQTTVNRRRPRARRRFSTARPPRLDIRLRNPCSRLRGIRFGWYVRFGIESLTTSQDTRARWSKNAEQVHPSIRQRVVRPALPGLRSLRRFSRSLDHSQTHGACSARSSARYAANAAITYCTYILVEEKSSAARNPSGPANTASSSHLAALPGPAL